MNSEKEIKISFKEVFDYIRDKDILIEDLRFKLDKYKTTIDKIKEYVENLLKEDLKLLTLIT